MEEKNKLKIKLSTAIVVVFILIVAIIIAISIMTYINSKEPKNESEIGENNNMVENEITNQNIDKPSEIQTIANADFDLKFLKLENYKKNMVYSPLSIKYALNMLNDGSNGNTKTQIEKVIGNNNLNKYNNIEGVLSLANSLYIRNTYSPYVLESYKSNLINKYNSEVISDEFKDASNINSWIENKTLGQIKNLLTDEKVNNVNNEMILINALAIDMKWKKEFKVEETSGKTFYLDNGNTMNATTMGAEIKNSSDVSYYKNENITALSMDLQEYENSQMQFIAVMPNQNLAGYVENFSLNELKSIIDNFITASEVKAGLKISIPKFSFDYNLDLMNDLKQLGITDAFDENLADFSNMSNSPTPLWIGDAIHKANIDFSEEGVKASAVTVFSMMDSAMIQQEDPEEVKIDKPFIYFIRDKKTNDIWFVGTVYEPNSWEIDKSSYYGM